MRQKLKAETILECYRFAAQARHMAETATNPFERADLIEVEERWLSLARSPRTLARPRAAGHPRSRRTRLTQPLNSFAFARTSFSVLPTKPAISEIDIPRARASCRKNRSACTQGACFQSICGDDGTLLSDILATPEPTDEANAPDRIIA